MTDEESGVRRPFLPGATAPVSGASIAVFRIAFGVFMVVDVGLYLPSLVTDYYVVPTVHFPYDPWGLVRPLPGPVAMHLVYVAMGLAGALIAIGLFYRWAAATFFVLTTYVFLIDSSYYQNHEYLICLMALLLALLPAHRMWSLDAHRRPAIASRSQPAWVLWLLRFQVGVPYVYGGIAKLNPDWLAGQPMRLWLADRTDVAVIGRHFTHEGVVWFATYGSLLFDLTVVGFLLHRRTRVPAFVVAVIFHLLNARLFGLFVFPWLMIAATTLFFAADWPLRANARLSGLRRPHPVPGSRRDAARWSPPRGAPPGGRRGLRPGVTAVVVVWVVVQLVVPLRHLAIPGYVSWTEEGHRFAWHMMLRTKVGTASFVVDDGERTWRVDPGDHLGAKQTYRLPADPERLARFAHHLSDLHGPAEVRAETAVSLNGRDPAPIVDPTRDLSAVRVPWRGHAEWIQPLDEPLPRHR